jgi:magnesium chelatase subunit D
MTLRTANNNKPQSHRDKESKKPVYPFTAIVGQEEMKLALLLNVIDPLIGGVLIMGHRGTGKSTAVRALADLLPPIWKVSECVYACDPADVDNLCADCFEQLQMKGKLSRTRARVPVVDLPLGATEDRVCGTINFERALKDGIKAFDAGLLARANRGFLYVDEVNLLEDHLVDLLLDVAVTGRNTVEREGISLEHPARFVLVGSGNPEEGELRPQLLDRFGLHAEVKTVLDLEQRVRIVELREAFERDQQRFLSDAEAEQQSLRRRLVRAQKLVGQVKLSQKLLRHIAELCVHLKIDGHRGELTTSRAARALAAFEGRRVVSEDDVRRVAALALRHRLRRDPLEPTDGGSRIEQALENSLPQTQSNKSEDKGNDSPDETGGMSASEKKSSGRSENGNSAQANDAKRHSPALLKASLPAEFLKHELNQTPQRQTQNQSARAQRNLKSSSYNTRHGRYARAVMHKSDGAKIALDATLRAAAIHRSSSSKQQQSKDIESAAPIPFFKELRYKLFKRKQGTLFILAVDTSGSMALNRIERAKGTLVWLLEKSYLSRDRVAIVSFRGQSAEEILPPSQSMSRARRQLDALLMGGPTPLSSALACSLRIAGRAARQGTERIMLLLFTDGRPNVPLREQGKASHAIRQSMIMSELETLGASLRRDRVNLIVIDTQSRYTSSGEGQRLASHLGGRYVYLPSGSEHNL